MGQVRIIGGRWKRTPLTVDDAKGLRPTPDRVRETLFNWLGQQLHGWRCLDVFAGSGALGLEAASRGASEVVLIEQDPKTAQRLAQSIDHLRAQDLIQLVRADGLKWLARKAQAPITQSFDLIFLDPPFGLGLLQKALPLAAPLLAAGGLIYAESDHPVDLEQASAAGLELARADKAGMVHYHLLRQCERPEEHDADRSLSRDV